MSSRYRPQVEPSNSGPNNLHKLIFIAKNVGYEIPFKFNLDSIRRTGCWWLGFDPGHRPHLTIRDIETQSHLGLQPEADKIANLKPPPLVELHHVMLPLGVVKAIITVV
jgi:hypothetical protein